MLDNLELQLVEGNLEAPSSLVVVLVDCILRSSLVGADCTLVLAEYTQELCKARVPEQERKQEQQEDCTKVVEVVDKTAVERKTEVRIPELGLRTSAAAAGDYKLVGCRPVVVGYIPAPCTALARTQELEVRNLVLACTGVARSTPGACRALAWACKMDRTQGPACTAYHKTGTPRICTWIHRSLKYPKRILLVRGCR